MSTVERRCDICGKTYMADTRNLDRGWGLCCCKSCAAIKRERDKNENDKTIKRVNNKSRKNKQRQKEIQKQKREYALEIERKYDEKHIDDWLIDDNDKPDWSDDEMYDDNGSWDDGY